MTGSRSKAADTITLYGHRWQTAIYPDEWTINAFLYERDDIRATSKHFPSKGDCFRRMIKIHTPENVFVWSKWVDDFIDGWCESNCLTVWGASSTTKSGIAARIILEDLLVAPMDTFCLVVTNPIEKHGDRMYGSFLKWLKALPPERQMIGTARKANPMGFLTSEGDSGQRTGLVCISNKPGDSFEDLKRYLGTHVERNRLVVDEPQGCSHSVVKIKNNLGASGSYKEIFIGNPDGWSSPLGIHSEPKDGNRKRIIEEQPDVWETRNHFKGLPGRCIVFDGRKAPSMKEPEKYPFMIQPDFAESIAKLEGPNSRFFWTYIVGRIPPGGHRLTCITESDIDEIGARACPHKFSGTFEDWVGLDLSQGGPDNCVVYRARVGPFDGMKGNRVKLLEKRYIKPDITRPDISGQIAAEVVGLLGEWDIPIHRVAGDSSGNQGALLDRIESVLGQTGLVRVSSEGGATDRPVKAGVPQTGKERYRNRATEIVMQVAELLKHRQLWNICDEATHQITTRGLSEAADDESGPKRRQCIEPKSDWRQANSGRSPDELDAIGVLVDALIGKGIIVIAEDDAAPNAAMQEWSRRKKTIDVRRRRSRLGALVRKF